MQVWECQNEALYCVQCEYANTILRSHSSKEKTPSVNYFPNAASGVSLSTASMSSLWGMVTVSAGLFGVLYHVVNTQHYSARCCTRHRAAGTAWDFQKVKPHGERGSLWTWMWRSTLPACSLLSDYRCGVTSFPTFLLPHAFSTIIDNLQWPNCASTHSHSLLPLSYVWSDGHSNKIDSW